MTFQKKPKAPNSDRVQAAQNALQAAQSQVHTLTPKSGLNAAAPQSEAYGSALRTLSAAKSELEAAQLEANEAAANERKTKAEASASKEHADLMSRITARIKTAKELDRDTEALKAKAKSLDATIARSAQALLEGRRQAAQAINEGQGSAPNTMALLDALENQKAAFAMLEETLANTESKRAAAKIEIAALQDEIDTAALRIAEIKHAAALQVYLPVFDAMRNAHRKAGHGRFALDVDREHRSWRESQDDAAAD
jgi:chromosome segregation ATPase